MKIEINGDQSFKVLIDRFAVAPSASGYQVCYSADNSVFTPDPQAIVPSGENLVYLGAMRYGYYKLSGNTQNNLVVIL